MEELKEKKAKFSLPNEHVTVRFIPRRKGMAANVEDNHVIAGGLLSKSITKYYAPIQKNGAIANILSKEEKEYLEEATGLNLSVYSDFFKSFFVPLKKDSASNKFYLGDPMDYIAVALLKHCNGEIAKCWADRDRTAEYKFAITKDGEVQNEVKRKLDYKKDAFKLYGKMEDDRDKLISVLRVLTNKPIAQTSKLSWVQGEVEKIVDGNAKHFLEVVNDPQFETKVLLAKAIAAKEVVKEGKKYVTREGLELAEAGQIPTYTNAVNYLDNDKNQEVRLYIEAKLEN